MVLTKKRVAIVTVILTVVFFILLFYLPESIAGERRDNILLFAPKIMFLSVTAAIMTAFILILIFKRDFISWQLFSFSRYKHYLRLIVKRDFVARYRKSVLGVLWSLLNPLLTMLVLAFVFTFLFRRFDIEYFHAYILSGLLIYNFFNESTMLAMN